MNSLRVSCIAEKALLFLFTEQNLVPNELFLQLVKELALDRDYLSQAPVRLPPRVGAGAAVKSAVRRPCRRAPAPRLGCSGKPPVLSRVFGRVIYVHDAATNTNRETLGVYLVASDPDGMENLSAFYVINDDAQLFWKVDSGAWVISTAEGETWIGTTSLAMPGSAASPRANTAWCCRPAEGPRWRTPSRYPSARSPPRRRRYPTAVSRERPHPGVGRQRPVRDLGIRKGRQVRSAPPRRRPKHRR